MSIGAVTIYSVGLVHLSACAPVSMSEEEVENNVNGLSPSGTTHGWKISEENFSGGEPNPCPCNAWANHQHFLFVC